MQFNIEPLPENQSEEYLGSAESNLVAVEGQINAISGENKQTMRQVNRTTVEAPSEAVQAAADQGGVKTWELFWFARVLMLTALLMVVVGTFVLLMQLLGLK